MLKPKTFIEVSTFLKNLLVNHATNSVSECFRRSHQRCSMKKGVLRNFTKFTGKHLCQSFFFNKAVGLGLRACNVIKKETQAQAFSCECCEISKNTFLQNTTGRLLLVFLSKTLRRLKTFLRTSMSQERLNNLMLWTTYNEWLDGLN